MAVTFTATLPTYNLMAADLLKAFGPLPVTDGESISPESHRSSGSGPEGFRVASDHARGDSDAIGPTADMLSG